MMGIKHWSMKFVISRANSFNVFIVNVITNYSIWLYIDAYKCILTLLLQPVHKYRKISTTLFQPILAWQIILFFNLRNSIYIFISPCKYTPPSMANPSHILSPSTASHSCSYRIPTSKTYNIFVKLTKNDWAN